MDYEAMLEALFDDHRERAEQIYEWLSHGEPANVENAIFVEVRQLHQALKDAFVLISRQIKEATA